MFNAKKRFLLKISENFAAARLKTPKIFLIDKIECRLLNLTNEILYI